MRRVLRVIAPFVLVCAASPAWAQSDEQRANARALADQGAQAFNEGHWQEAIDLFDRAESLVDAPTHLLFSARAHGKLRHYVKARELYLRIGRLQLAPNAPNAFRNAQTSAAEELKVVEPHIARLTITVHGPDPKAAKVTLDGAAMESVLIGVARPIDPGEHQLHAEAPGFAALTKSIIVADGSPLSVTPELTPAPGGAESVSAPEATSMLTATPAGDASTVDVAPSRTNGKRVASYVAFGVGAVGLGVGSIFLANSASKRSQADQKFAACGGATGCTNANPLSSQVGSLDDSARSAERLGVFGLVVGGVAVATGVTLFVLSRPHEASSTGWTIAPRIGLGSASVDGTF